MEKLPDLPNDAISMERYANEASDVETGSYPIRVGDGKYDTSWARMNPVLDRENREIALAQWEYLNQAPCSESEMIKFNKIKEKYGDEEIPQSALDRFIFANRINTKCENKLDYLNKHRGIYSRKPIEGGKKSKKKKRATKKRKTKRGSKKRAH